MTADFPIGKTGLRCQFANLKRIARGQYHPVPAPLKFPDNRLEKRHMRGVVQIDPDFPPGLGRWRVTRGFHGSPMRVSQEVSRAANGRQCCMRMRSCRCAAPVQWPGRREEPEIAGSPSAWAAPAPQSRERLSATKRCWPELNCGYIGSDRIPAAAFSATGKSPF